jgi:hypothetical protein
MRWAVAVVVLLHLGIASADDKTWWSFVEVPGAGYYWQYRSILPVDATTTTLAALEEESLTEEVCPEGMVHVRGEMLQGGVERLQDRVCVEWLGGPDAVVKRCARFDRDMWLELSADLRREPMDFCIDRFEYPNVLGAHPAVSVSWNEATRICQVRGSRLCTEDEWTFACEGEEGIPYPYGYERDSEACNIDRPWLDYHDYPSLTPRRQAEGALSALWQGAASGVFPECVSEFGVYDMTGNLDEWTTSTSDTGYASIMKGGYWSNVRNRCRPATRVHAPSFVFYQQGFRCCTDVDEEFELAAN